MSLNFTDEEVVSGLLGRDESIGNDIISFLYLKNESAIHNYVGKNSGNHEDAEDLVQDTMIALVRMILRGKYTLRSDVKLNTYILSIAKKLWLKKIRRDRNKLGWENNFSIQLDKSESITALDKIIEEQELEGQRNKFNQLGKDCQGILTAFYANHLSLREIAEKFGYSNANAVKVKKFRCMQVLKGLMQ